MEVFLPSSLSNILEKTSKRGTSSSNVYIEISLNKLKSLLAFTKNLFFSEIDSTMYPLLLGFINLNKPGFFEIARILSKAIFEIFF